MPNDNITQRLKDMEIQRQINDLKVDNMKLRNTLSVVKVGIVLTLMTLITALAFMLEDYFKPFLSTL